MPAYLEEQYDLLAMNQTFRKRVVMGFFTVAREVLGAAPTGEDLLQRGFARNIIMNTDVSQNGYVAAIATDPTVVAAAVAGYNPTDANSAQAAVTNDEILQAIRIAWDVISGA